jgi:sporulation protein YlmC with PRC-barrel domain
MLITRWLMVGLCSFALVSTAAAQQTQPQQTPDADRPTRVEAEREPAQPGERREDGQQDQQKADELQQQAEQKAEEAKQKAQEARQLAQEARRLSQQAEQLRGQRDREQIGVRPAPERDPALVRERETEVERERRAYRPSMRGLKTSDLEGMNVRNRQGDDLGTVNDLLADPQTGEIQYVIVSFGGWFGIGDNQVVIPWDAVEIRREVDGDDQELLLDMTEEQLENAPKYEDDDTWFGDDTRRQEVDTFYRERRQTRPRDTTEPGIQPGTRTQPGQPGAQPGQPREPGQPGQPGTQPGQPGTQPGQPGTQP